MSKLSVITHCWAMECANYRYCKIAMRQGPSDVIPKDCPLPDADVILKAANAEWGNMVYGDGALPKLADRLKEELKKAGVEI